MARLLDARGPKRDTNVKTAQLVQLISEIGPDIPEISRRLGQYKESVRYRYKTKIVDKGFAIQAAVEYRKLGLRHLEIAVDFSDEFREYAQPILIAMSELCYISGFEKLFPKGDYLVGANVPEELVDDFADLMNGLKEKGVFSSVEILPFTWFRRIPMHVRYYDFNASRWDFDWSTQIGPDPNAAAYTSPHKAKFDYIDLLILKELYIDATQSMVDIARKIGQDYKKLAWHYNTHVLGLGLVKGYSVRWPGTKYDPEADRVRQRQHKYFWIDLLIKNLSEMERMSLMSNIHAVPFVWAEAGGTNYFVQLAIPIEFYTEAMQYFENVLGPFRGRAELLLMDQTNALDFTISYKLYDQESRKWTLDVLQLGTRFDELIMKIREGRG